MYSAFCHLFSVANYYVRKNAVLISIITLVQHAHYKYIAKMRMYEYRSVSTLYGQGYGIRTHSNTATKDCDDEPSRVISSYSIFYLRRHFLLIQIHSLSLETNTTKAELGDEQDASRAYCNALRSSWSDNFGICPAADE
jgi:hypothetical protein